MTREMDAITPLVPSLGFVADVQATLPMPEEKPLLPISRTLGIMAIIAIVVTAACAEGSNIL